MTLERASTTAVLPTTTTVNNNNTCSSSDVMTGGEAGPAAGDGGCIPADDRRTVPAGDSSPVNDSAAGASDVMTRGSCVNHADDSAAGGGSSDSVLSISPLNHNDQGSSDMPPGSPSSPSITRNVKRRSTVPKGSVTLTTKHSQSRVAPPCLKGLSHTQHSQSSVTSPCLKGLSH